MLCNITQNAMGLPGGVPYHAGGGGYPTMPGGTLPGGSQVHPAPRPGQDGGEGGSQLGQQKEYSLHGGRYASCVHAGGLSCYTCNRTKIKVCFNLQYFNSFRLVKSYVGSLGRWRTVICTVQIHHGVVDLLLLLPHCSFPCTLQNFKLSS